MKSETHTVTEPIKCVIYPVRWGGAGVSVGLEGRRELVRRTCQALRQETKK